MPRESLHSTVSPSFARLLYDLDKEPDSEVTAFDYSHAQNWGDIDILLQNSVLRQLSSNAETVCCKSCSGTATVIQDAERYYYRCTDCRDLGKLTLPEISRYSFDFLALGEWISRALPNSLVAVESGRLLRLGKVKLRPGEFVVYLLRGADWEDSKRLWEQCKPKLRRDFSVVLTLCQNEIAASIDRTMQVPLAEVFLPDQAALLDKERLEDRLWAIYGGTPASRHKEQKQEAATEWLRKKIAAGEIQRGDRDITLARMKDIFALGRDKAQEIWTATVPEKLKKSGRKAKTVRKNVQ